MEIRGNHDDDVQGKINKVMDYNFLRDFNQNDYVSIGLISHTRRFYCVTRCVEITLFCINFIYVMSVHIYYVIDISPD